MNYVDANTISRQRLRIMAESLIDKELALELGDGWTIAAILAHLAFWDYRVLELLVRWKKVGVGRSPIDVDAVNDAIKPLCLAIAGHEAVRIAVSAAEAVDSELECLPVELKPDIDALVNEGKLRLDRSIHRNEHLDQIEALLVMFRREDMA